MDSLLGLRTVVFSFLIVRNILPSWYCRLRPKHFFCTVSVAYVIIAVNTLEGLCRKEELWYLIVLIYDCIFISFD